MFTQMRQAAGLGDVGFRLAICSGESERSAGAAAVEIRTAPVLILRGRCLFADLRETPCEVELADPVSLLLRADGDAEVGARVIAYIDGLGRIEGQIAHASDRGLLVSIRATEGKQARLARRLNWLARSAEAEVEDRRRHERSERREGQLVLISCAGVIHRARIIDESATGMALRSEINFVPGTNLFVMGRRAQVVRSWRQGVAVKWLQEGAASATLRGFSSYNY